MIKIFRTRNQSSPIIMAIVFQLSWITQIYIFKISFANEHCIIWCKKHYFHQQSVDWPFRTNYIDAPHNRSLNNISYIPSVKVHFASHSSKSIKRSEKDLETYTNYKWYELKCIFQILKTSLSNEPANLRFIFSRTTFHTFTLIYIRWGMRCIWVRVTSNFHNLTLARIK